MSRKRRRRSTGDEDSEGDGSRDVLQLQEEVMVYDKAQDLEDGEILEEELQEEEEQEGDKKEDSEEKDEAVGILDQGSHSVVDEDGDVLMRDASAQ